MACEITLCAIANGRCESSAAWPCGSPRPSTIKSALSAFATARIVSAGSPSRTAYRIRHVSPLSGTNSCICWSTAASISSGRMGTFAGNFRITCNTVNSAPCSFLKVATNVAARLRSDPLRTEFQKRYLQKEVPQGARPDREYGTRCPPDNFFRDRTQQKFSQSTAAPRSENQINAFVLDCRFKHRPY
jgi:hypothetical protein